MFENIHLSSILAPAIIIVVVAALVVRTRINTQSPAAQRAMVMFRLTTIATAVVLIVLWFLLPVTPVLSTFGYPQSVDDIQTPKRLLYYLQSNNKAVVRTTEVLSWFLFIFVWWFLAAFYALTKTIEGITNIQPKPSSSLPDDERS